jgi:thiol:disulfide interchange protein DsbD
MNYFSILTVYISGVATSFTPCVYPLLPIVISYIGAQAEANFNKKVFLLISYVLGTAIVYTILGIVASVFGLLFGQIQQSFIVNFLVGIICLLFSLSMFGVFSLSINIPVANKFFHGPFGGFVLGATSGLVFSPCTTPVLGTILTIVSTKQSVVYGAVLLFFFALGLSTTIILAGLFSSVLTKLPKSGKWNLIIEKIFAVALLVVAVYYIVKGIRILI